MLVSVWSESIVRGPHGDIQIDKVVDEAALEALCSSRWKLVIDVFLNVPHCVAAKVIAILLTVHFILTKAPAGKDLGVRAEETAGCSVTETETCSETANAIIFPSDSNVL